MCPKKTHFKKASVKSLITLPQGSQEASEEQNILNELQKLITNEMEDSAEFYTAFALHSKMSKDDSCPTIVAMINETKIKCGIDSKASINAMSIESSVDFS